jgi:16S rRNA (guanine527-N7)-methyltransferase
VLAILFPEKKITLLDSNGKKTRFLTQIIYDLKLPSVTVFQSRVENFTGQFEHIISRAFSSLRQFVMLTEHLCAPRGERLAMKGDLSEKELSELPFSSSVIPLVVPALLANRCLVRVTMS